VPRTPLHLSRLRGRSTRSIERGGWGCPPSSTRFRSGAPTPALPRKREREGSAAAAGLNLRSWALDADCRCHFQTALSRRASAPRGAMRCARAIARNFRPHERARGMPGAQCTRSLECAGGSQYALEYSQRRHRKHPAFPTQWFYGFFRALPGDHRFVDPVIRATRWRLANLTPASGRQNHTASPSATGKRSSHAPSRPPHPAPRS
jgi:hypothetical protein